MKSVFKSKLMLMLIALVLLAVAALPLAISVVGTRAAPTAAPHFASQGELDCNGFSKIQHPLKSDMACTDIQGYDGGRGYDNGHYIGHDEPSVQFISKAAGSGHNVQWKITLPKEHPLPAIQTYENYITFWYSMAICDPNSYPQNPCIPDSDKNPAGEHNSQDAGSAFMELQFYPPGFPPMPFINKISCDLTHWCAAMTIDSLECTFNFTFCNPNCTEPVNFAFIQMDGVPTGPPGSASANASTFTPNSQTLLMNQGDTLNITIKDTPAGLFNRVVDKTTGKSGYMVASAANGFQHLDLKTCAPSSFTFHPEFATARFGNFVPWAALQANIGFAVEIGHFIPGLHGDHDADDPPCFNDPLVPGCLGADLDFDGTSYRPDWPNGTPHTPTPFKLSSVLGGFGPVSAPDGSNNYSQGYGALQFETDVLASESTCKPTGAGCTAPPRGAEFYPFYAQAGHGKSCYFTFGNVIPGVTTNAFGRDREYNGPYLSWFFGTASSGIRGNPCIPQGN